MIIALVLALFACRKPKEESATDTAQTTTPSTKMNETEAPETQPTASGSEPAETSETQSEEPVIDISEGEGHGGL